MDDQLTQLRASALADLDAALDEQAVEAIRIKYLGRAGSISLASEGMRSVPKEDKGRIGKLLNEVRSSVMAGVEARKSALASQRDAAALAGIDVTLPGTPV